jgi:hypothetical protein
MAQTNLGIKLLVWANSSATDCEKVVLERPPVSTRQEIPRHLITWRSIGLFWGETAVSQTNLIDLFTSYSCKIHLNNITNSTHSFIHSFTRSFIHSFRNMTYNRFITSSKATSPQGAISCSLFQFTVLSFLPRLPNTSILSSVFPS